MRKKKNPQTSNDAFRAVTPDMLTRHHGKIIEAMKKCKFLPKGMMYEQIAVYTKMDKHQVGRRLSELEAMQLIYKTGHKINTTTGRAANAYKLVEGGEVSAKPEKMLPGKTVSEYSKAIQKTLF